MTSYKPFVILTIICFVILLSACSTQAVPAATQTPKSTITPTKIPQPTATPNPNPPIIPNGTIYYSWHSYAYDQNSPYLVWGAHLRDVMNGSCKGFICGNKDVREYDPSVWKFLGRGSYGKTTFTFTEPLDTFVINYFDRMGFDALSGITLDNKSVSYGFLANGEVTTSYMDTGNFGMATIGHAEDNFTTIFKPCGMIDPNPNGDMSYNVSLGSGGIVFNFLDRAWGNRPYLTRKGYLLTSLTIVSAPISKITQKQICQ